MFMSLRFLSCPDVLLTCSRYGRVFHPQIMLHHIIASRVIFEMGRDNEARNDYPEIPESISVDSCPYEAPEPEDDDDEDEGDDDEEKECVGNQIQGDCIQGHIPEKDDFSGPQMPVCNKWPDSPRVNKDKAFEAATRYCKELADAGFVLEEGGTSRVPYSLKDAAEDGGAVALTVLYFKQSCPQDESTDVFEFSGNEEKCVENFYDMLEMACTMDSTWNDYNEDYTMLGGVYGADCGLFAISGVKN